MKKLKVMEWNLNGRAKNGGYIYPVKLILDNIAQINPDIIVFTELANYNKASDDEKKKGWEGLKFKLEYEEGYCFYATDNGKERNDVGIAVNTLAATAWEHKVGSCIMASINAPKIQDLLGIPEGYKVRLALALGYPSHKSTVVALKDSLDYYLDEERNYYVPKRAIEDIVIYK